MDIIHRTKRILLAFRNIDPDSKHNFGHMAEKYVRNMLLTTDMHIFTNKIIKYQKSKSRYIESDIILYSGNTVFCIEVKRLKGKIFSVGGSIVQEKHKSFEKRFHNYQAKKIKNPVTQSAFFTKTLKRHLMERDRRFKDITFLSVVVFSKEVDMSSVHDFDGGVLYIDELLEFIYKHTDKNVTNQDWVIRALDNLKGFDILINRNNLDILGLIVGDRFQCLGKNGAVSIPYSNIKSISITRKTFFSSFDSIEIIKKDGKTLSIPCYEGSVSINTFDEIQSHFLRNINRIYINSK